MRLFNVDFSILVRTLVPVSLRNAVQLAWLNALVSPVQWLYTQFTGNRLNNLYRLSHNGQVCYLEAALNDLFDPVARRLVIVDGPFEDPLFVYLAPENKPLWLGLVSETGATPYPDPQVLYTNAETTLLGVSFIVQVPASVAAGPGYSLNRLRALVNTYRLPGKNNYTVTIL